MRIKKASINVFVNFLTFFSLFIPNLIVTKVFLDTLGIELLGLNSLYSNIIGLLTVVELGIGSAIIFSLYKPFAEENWIKVKGYLNFYSKVYKFVGLIILLLGILIVPFLHLIIKNEVNIQEAQIYFILFLINTFITYLFSYKLCILVVAQEEYKLSIATTLSKLLIFVLQIFMLKIFPSLFLFLIIQIIINLIFYLFINRYINNKYNWLNNSDGRITKEEKKKLYINVKALFYHKVGGVLVLGTDNILIASFINLATVGIFNNFYMVISAAQSLIYKSLSGVTASIGNLLVENDKEYAYKVHKRLFFLSFWIVSFITISLYNTITQFVHLWLNQSQILDQLTLTLLLINFYFILMRGSVERFKDAAGIFHQDRYAPILESIINLILSIILVMTIGLPGIFLGTLISNLLIVFWIKPMLVYKYVFNKPLSLYFKMYYKYLMVSFIPLVCTNFVTNKINGINSIYAFSINVLINIVIINLIYLIIFRKNEDFLYFKSLLLNLLKK